MSSSPFNFPGGDMQSIHAMGVQSRRARKELPASVMQSLLPLIPAFNVQTRTYDRVDNRIPDIWLSDILTVPDPDVEGRDIAFVTMDGDCVGTNNILDYQIMRNGVCICQCGPQGAWDVLGTDNPHQYGMWAGLVKPGDEFCLRASMSSGDMGTLASSTNVTLALASIHFRQSK